MWKLTFAVGLAAGYVLGTRAGRERYEQIAESARGVVGHPVVVRARSKAKEMVGVGADAGTAAVTTKIGFGVRGVNGSAAIDDTVL